MASEAAPTRPGRLLEIAVGDLALIDRLRLALTDPVDDDNAIEDLAEALVRPSGLAALRTVAGPPAATARMP